MKTQWGARTDGRDVWAIDLKRGTQRKFLRTDDLEVSGVHMSGDDVVIAYENGRVRVWNPSTDSVRTVL